MPDRLQAQQQHAQQTADAIVRILQIRAERDALADHRHRLWRQLAEQFDEGIARRADALSRRLVQLEDEGRLLRASVRFGTRREILGRARMELTVVRGLGDEPA